LLPKSPRLRRILFAYAVNELGSWFGYVALALGVYDHTRDAIAIAGLFVARGLLPALLAPVLVARVERSPRRGHLTTLYCAEATLTVGLAALLWHFSLPGVLTLVALDGICAVAATALVRAAAGRALEQEGSDRGESSERMSPSDLELDGESRETGSPEYLRQANAALNMTFMLGLTGGPAVGGVLVSTIGGPLALIVDACTFLACAWIVRMVGTHVHEGAADSVRARLVAALRHVWGVPALRGLLVTEAIAIAVFASVEPVEVVYAKATLDVGSKGFGALMAIWGAGAALGALLFVRRMSWPLGSLLTIGTLLVGLAYLGFALAPTFAIACCAALIGGIGNGVQWPSFISAVQQQTPRSLQGRLMSAVGSLNALCPVLGFMIGGTIVALSSTRIALAIAGGVATLATLAFTRLRVRSPASDAAPTAGDAELANPLG
jgi:MFS family permease